MKLLCLSLLFVLAGLSLHAQETADSIHTNVDSAAQYPGGREAWIKFLRKNLKYPQEAMNNEIQGVIAIKFIVDKDGSVSDVQAISGPAELRPEGIRMINLTTKWIPATVNNVPVKAYKIQEFTFKLEGKR